MHGAVLAEHALALRIFCEAADRLLIANLGADLELPSPAEPLLAPSSGDWRVLWSSEAIRYGGQGYGPAYVNGGFSVPARSTILFAARDEI